MNLTEAVDQALIRRSRGRLLQDGMLTLSELENAVIVDIVSPCSCDVHLVVCTDCDELKCSRCGTHGIES